MISWRGKSEQSRVRREIGLNINWRKQNIGSHFESSTSGMQVISGDGNR